MNVIERTAHEDLLHDSEARFRATFEQGVVGIARIAPDGRFLEVNDRLCQIVGWSRTDLLAHAFHEITHPDDLTGELRSLERVLAGELATYALEKRYMTHESGSVWVNITKSLVRGRDGTPQYLMAVIEDISARKRVEEELQRVNAEFERFAYVASHDLQEPLRTVSSYVQLLARRYRDRLDSDANEFIDFAVQGANRMQQLINDLLRLSRVGSKGGGLVATSAAAVLDAVLESMQASIADAGVTITHDPMPDVLADPSQLGQVFTNLVENAIKFHGHEPSRLHIDVVPAHDTWVFGVRDNGIGIDAQYFDRVFVIFQRLHARDEYPGTGVGLAIVKKIVERHGGRIWIESRVGEGTTFHFTLLAAPSSGRPTTGIPGTEHTTL